MTHAVIGWKSVLFESIEHRAELKLSRQLLNCTVSDFLRDFLTGYFFLIESENPEQASQQIATKEPNKVCKHARRRIVTWAETKILKE